MKTKDIADIAYKNGYNRGIKEVFTAAKTSAIILSILIAVCFILTTVTTVKLVKFEKETTEKLTELSNQINTITVEFRDLAYRVDQLENN